MTAGLGMRKGRGGPLVLGVRTWELGVDKTRGIQIKMMGAFCLVYAGPCASCVLFVAALLGRLNWCPVFQMKIPRFRDVL